MATRGGVAQAQLQDQATCAPPSYVLKVQPASGSRMQLSASLNGGAALKVNSARSTGSVKADVTGQVRPTGNALQIQWTVTDDANKPDTRPTWVSLQMGHGASFTPVAVLRSDYYPGRTSLNFKFDAPPKGNLQCDVQAAQYSVTLGQAVGEGRVTQDTLSANGKFYAISTNEPSDMMRGLRLDLHPYLVHGKNHVRLLWQVLRQQNGSDGPGAQITRTADGKTQVLAKTLVQGKQGAQGQLQATITVP